MSDVNKRLADILAEYTAAMIGIERPPPEGSGPCVRRDRWVLKPADRQRACTAPTIESPKTLRDG
jgi:hypothetical protein